MKKIQEEQEDSEEEGPIQRWRQRKGSTDSAMFVKPLESPGLQSDEEVESGEVVGVNADGSIEEQDLESQYFKLFSRATFLDSVALQMPSYASNFYSRRDVGACSEIFQNTWLQKLHHHQFHYLQLVSTCSIRMRSMYVC